MKKLNGTYEKEIQKLKEELRKSKEYINRDKKDKNEVLKKISELTEENQKYIKEKQIIEQKLNKKEQELNKKEQELNKKEQELANDKKTIDNLNIEIKLLKIKGSKDSSTPNKIPQSVRKRDDKARTFASEDLKKDSLPEYNEKSNRLENLEKEYQKIYIPNLSELLNTERDATELKKLDIEQIERDLKNGEFY